MVHLDGEMRLGFHFKVSLLKNGTSLKDNGCSSLTINNDKSFSNSLW
jgi:hypothetical protein